MARKPAKRKPSKPAKPKPKAAAPKPKPKASGKPRGAAAGRRTAGTPGTRKKRGRSKPKRPTVDFAEKWMGKFIDHLRDGGTVSVACELAVIGRSTAYRHRQKDETFAIAWADAEEESTDRLEEEAYRRAVKGVKKPVHYEGRRIDFVDEYSDTLLIFLLKARKPETYRDRIDHRHSGGIARPGGSSSTADPGIIDLTLLEQEEIDALERIQLKATRTEEAQT